MAPMVNLMKNSPDFDSNGEFPSTDLFL